MAAVCEYCGDPMAGPGTLCQECMDMVRAGMRIETDRATQNDRLKTVMVDLRAPWRLNDPGAGAVGPNAPAWARAPPPYHRP